MTRAILSVLLLAVVACAKPPALDSAPAPDNPPEANRLPAADSQTPAPADYPLSEAPAVLRPAIDRAQAAIKSLKGALGKRLMGEMKAGGPSKAINVCRDEAAAITASVSDGVEVGRTSARLRNPNNAAPAWLVDLVERTATAKASEVEPRVYDLGDKIGVAQPIGVIGVCLNCHGALDRIDASVKQTLATWYPNDRATGFETGDLRGLFWAVADK